MRRLLAVSVGAALAAAAGVPAAGAGAAPLPVDGGMVVQQCYARASSQVDDAGYQFCRSLEAAVDAIASGCRAPERSVPDAARPDYCAELDGRDIREAQIAAYEQSWVHRALALQRGLDAAAPLWEEQLPHTHNSFNASSYVVPTNGATPSYYATLTNQDPNQVYSITDQLRMDIRALEIDVHWMPSPYGSAATNGYWPTMCHGDGRDPSGQGLYVEIGCTDDRPFQDGLAELRRWLDANPHEFVLLYLENQLHGAPAASAQLAHDTAAGIIRQQLGAKVAPPPAGLPAGTCAPMPYGTSRAQLLAQGRQVMLVGNCGPGAWNQWVFTRGPSWDESGDPSSYDAKQCAADSAAREAHTSFRRYYQESTWLESMMSATMTITPETTQQMVRCGVNIIGFDQLQPQDGRLAALVWSWAPNEPAATGDCALRGTDGRFRSAACSGRYPFACVDGRGDWHVSRKAGVQSRGRRTCARQGWRFGTPPNGYRNAQLGSSVAWLDYTRSAAGWQVGPG